TAWMACSRWRCTLLTRPAGRSAARCQRCRRRHWSDWRAITGRATCASWRTPCSRRFRCARAAPSSLSISACRAMARRSRWVTSRWTATWLQFWVVSKRWCWRACTSSTPAAACWASDSGSRTPPSPTNCANTGLARKLEPVSSLKKLSAEGGAPTSHGEHCTALCGRRALAPNGCWEAADVRGSALDDIDRQPAAGGFLVFAFHVGAGLAHGADDLVQRDKVPAIATQGHACSVDGLYRAHGVALDAGHLDQAAYRVAGQAEVVLHADLGGVFHLMRRAAEHFAEGAGGHGAGDAHFTLAADFGTGDRGVLLVEDTDGRGGQQE